MAIRILFLISALCVFSISADVFVSIDCGSSDSYTDGNLITWTGDADNMQNGESYVVQTPSSISPVMDSLRAFTTRAKNCYAIEATKGERVLLRATFHYGNYDNKSSPPTFDLQFDGNRWASVETSSDGLVYYELIYVVKGDYVSVCVAQTQPDQVPFMSALEVRTLLPTMYDKLDRNYPLYLIARVAYGATATVRFADDPYDRIWLPVAAGDGMTALTSDAAFLNQNALDRPPPAVMRSAVSAVNATSLIQLSLGIPSGELPIYLTMYFSEVRELEATETRSFRIAMNNQTLLDEPFSPPYGNISELYASNLTVSSNMTIDLVPTANSTLPPLINAMEVFAIGDFLTDGTHTDDVEGLASLQNAFAELGDWSGDPCLPSPYYWDWINCTTDSPPRVTALYLGSFGLSGGLPDFSAMDALETIDFQNNSLDGPIPEFLAALPNLKQLNLGSNQFSGAIPDSLSEKKGLNLVVTGNPDLCKSGETCKTSSNSPTTDARKTSPGSPSKTTKKKKSNLGLILGITIPIFLSVWAIAGALVVLHNRRKAKAAASISAGAGSDMPQSSPLKTTPQMMNGRDEMKINLEDESGPVDDQTYDHGTTAHY